MAKTRDYLRIKVEINVVDPLSVGFSWTNDKGQEKWATFKFERLSELCYGCGCLGHSSQVCVKEILMDHQNEGRPLYGLWLQCTRPTTHRWHKIGGGGGRQRQEIPARDRSRQSWRDIMNASREGKALRGPPIPQRTLRPVPRPLMEAPPCMVTTQPAPIVDFLEPLEREGPTSRGTSSCLFDLNCPPAHEPEVESLLHNP